jgi:hypothetical protein
MSTTESAPVPDVDHFPITIMKSRRKAAADAIWAVILGAVAVSQYESNMSHSQASSATFRSISSPSLFVLCGRSVPSLRSCGLQGWSLTHMA